MNHCRNTLAAVSLFAAALVAGCESHSHGMGSSGDKSAPNSAAFDAIRGLSGTWVAVAPAEGQPPMTLVFKPTSGGSAIMETMAPGSDKEMVNLYTSDPKGVVLTHYCHMGNQPRMRATSIANGVIQFHYIDAGNLTSRDQPHMDSVEITINGDRLTEKWAMYHDGKIDGYHTFEFKRQS